VECKVPLDGPRERLDVVAILMLPEGKRDITPTRFVMVLSHTSVYSQRRSFAFHNAAVSATEKEDNITTMPGQKLVAPQFVLNSACAR